MPIAVQPWKEIESDPEYVALPEMDRGKVFEWWKGQVRTAAKAEGSPDDEIESELNNFTAQLGTRSATGAALTASEVMTAPLRMDWERPADSLGGIAIEPGSERATLPAGTDILPTVPDQDTGQGRFMSAMNAIGQTAMRIGGGALQSAGELLEGPSPDKVKAEIETLRAVMASEQPGVAKGDMDALKRYTRAYNRIRALEPDLEGRGELTSGAGMAMREKAGDVFQTNPRFAGEFWADVLPRGAGSLIPLALTRDPKLAAGLMGSSTFVEQRDANLARGMPEDEAVGRALATAATEAGLEYVGGKAVTGAAGKALGVEGRAARAGVAAAGEGLTEGSQNVAAAVINQQPIDYGMLGKEFAAGVLLGGGASVMFDPDTGIVRTPGGAVKDGRIIAESSPDAVAAQAMKGLDAVKPTEIAPPAGELPKLRSMETQGDLLSTQAEPEAFKLAGETTTDFDAVAQEQAAREAAQAESDKLQGDLFGGPPAEQPPRNLGPGAANIEEPIQTGPGATSTKNAVMEAERAARGADPIIKEARQTNPETLERAEQRVDSDPQAGAKIVERLISSTDRTISVEEEAVLLVEKVRLRNARAMEEERMADPNASPEERAVAQQEWGKLEEQINRMDQATHASGAIWGRLGQFRQRLLRSDYTFEAMERRARASKQGPLTPEESSKIKEQADKIAELQTKLDAVTKSKDEEFAGVSVDEAIRQIEAEAKKDPAFTPEVRSLADRIIASLDATANAALTRLRGKFGRTSAGVDPTILSDLVIYGASKIAKGFIKFGQWSTSMVREFGEDVKPYLPDAWKGANERLDAAVEKVPGKNKEKVKAAVRKTDTAGKLDEITAGMKESASEGTPLREMRRDVQRLAENFVRSGIKQREPLIDAVHEIVKQIDPNITRRETMDMISGYGDFKPLNPDQIKAELRDLKGQMQQVGKLEDITARKPLQRSGVEQRTPSNEERRLIQRLNEAKRRFGVVVTDPARQLKSALDARKTYVRNRLSDLRSEIANRERIVKERSLPPTDPELESLRAELDAVKAEHEAVFGKRELTDEQRLKLAISAAERTEAQWTKRLEDAQRGIFPSGRGPSKVPKSTQLDAIKARVEAAKAQVQELQDIADPNKALRSRLAARTAELQDKLARGDFSTRKRREYDVSKDPEAIRLLAEKQRVQDEFNAGRERDRLKNRTIIQKIWGGVKETLNLPRNILSSWDVSAVLRQGGFIGFGNPLRSIRATGTMLKALVSEKAASNADAQIRNRPNAPLYEKSKLYLPKLDDPRLTAQEEQIMSRIANKIPGLRASNRAFLTFLNKLRADSFDAMVASLTKKGAATQAELDAISSYINIATGRGDLGKAALAAETLATVFFSPRLLASRFQLIGGALSGFRYGGGSARTRKAIATEYAKTLLGLSVVIGLGKLAGAKLEEDPKDADFLKMQFGNTRVDPMMGLAQVTRFIAGEGMAAKRFFTKEKPKWGEGGADIAGKFLRTKLTPILGTALDIAQQKNVVGEKVTPQSAATQLVIPLSFRDISDVMKEHGMAEGTIFELLSMFGMSVNNYQERKR